MADSDSGEDPLLTRPVDSATNEKNIMKRRRLHCSNDPLIKGFPPQEQNDLGTILNPDSLAQNKLNVQKGLFFFTAYISLGLISFWIVRDQISGKKTNEFLDAVYFCVVTMTTVGYGDLIPVSNLAKLLACFLVFAGMALVGLVLSNAADFILEKHEILFVKATHMRRKHGETEILKEVEAYKAGYKFLTALSLLLVLTLVGIVFLHTFEGLSLLDALYCVCATITTLGYGDKSFSTKWGRLFASFWIFISTICLAQVFYHLAEMHTERRRWSFVKWVLARKLTVTDLEAADLDHDSAVSAAEFIVYKLKEMGKITDEDIIPVMEQFKNLDIDQSGTLTKSDILAATSSVLRSGSRSSLTE